MTAGDGKGNGTDYLETLFAKARTEASSLLDSINLENLDKTGLPSRYINWLKKPNDEFENNLAALQTYISVLSLEYIPYQGGGCDDPELKMTHGICYYDDNPYIARVVISKDRNKALTNTEMARENFEKAMAMLIHEAGHFAGVKNHLFLDDLGAKLAKLYTKKAFLALSK